MASLEEKHYKRSKYMIEKIKKTFPNGIYNKKQEQQLIQKELIRYQSVNDLATYDFINIGFLIGVALLGLNKESIERSEKHSEYEYPVKYKDKEMVTAKFASADKNTERNAQQILSWINNSINQEMNKDKARDTSYDEWLSIKNINTLPNYNYMFNIRNSLMHSEYYIDLFKGKPFFARLFNSNYTGFEATIFIPKFLEFIKHYFSNDAFFGVVDNLYLFDLDEKINVNNESDLSLYLKNQVKIIKVEYENKKKRQLLEKVILRNPQIPSKKLFDKYNIKSTDVFLNDDQINQILLNLRDYYGEEIFKIDKDKLMRIIVESIRYEINPKAVISSWLMHFYDMVSKISTLRPFEDDFVSGFALRPTLLVLQSYNALYRLQNKELQKFELDYESMNNVNYSFNTDDYTSFCDKLIEKGNYIDEIDAKKKYFTEVFRNSLAHGNIDFFCLENGTAIERYIKFEDKYKTRTRIVSVSLDELDKYLSSPCFESSQLKEKKVDDIETSTINKR